MSVTAPDQIDPAFYEEVRRTIVGMGEGDTKVLDVRLALIDDVTCVPAWRVTLLVPRPHGETWDAESMLDLKFEARQATDEIAHRRGVEVEGLTSMLLTTDDVDPADVVQDEDESAGSVELGAPDSDRG